MQPASAEREGLQREANLLQNWRAAALFHLARGLVQLEMRRKKSKGTGPKKSESYSLAYLQQQIRWGHDKIELSERRLTR